MNKKLVIAIVLLVIAISFGIAGYIILNKNQNNDNQNQISENKPKQNENRINNNETNENKTEISNETRTEKENKKILVAYFSAQNHTKSVAEKIANNLDADIFEIIPEQTYTTEDLDWTDDSSRVSREHTNEDLRNIKLTKTQVDNFEDYDTVLIGYPIWWGNAAWVVDNFVKENDFNGKTVIPFCTSSSSGLGQSGELLKQKANSGNWLEGHRFSSNPSDSDIKNWTDSIK